jgi:glutamyl-tRNA synthetase
MIRTRFAPSPTGFLHIGGLRTAAYAYAMAKHNNGQFIVRIEDTDQKREVPGSREKIFSTLQRFGLTWDESYIQSERVQTGIYEQAALKLIDSGHAFYCQCPPRNPKSGTEKVTRDPCRDLHLSSGAIKLRVPDGETVSFHDFVLDTDIEWKTDEVADITLLKTDKFPTYHLAVVVDDSAMQISHALRAMEWLPSTPVHLLTYRYLALTPPLLGHLTAVLDPSGGKLSKRKSNVSVEQFIADGYLPEALLNFIILLGWAPKDNREMFTLPEFVAAFDPHGFQKSNPVFHTEKLDWFNGQYIRQKSDTEIIQLVKPFMKSDQLHTKLNQIVPLIKDRLIKLSDIDSLTGSFSAAPEIDVTLFSDTAVTAAYLSWAQEWLASHPWSKAGLEDGWTDAIKAKGWKVGDFFMALRIAVWGSRFTPPITDTMVILGKAETVGRIAKAISLVTRQ